MQKNKEIFDSLAPLGCCNAATALLTLPKEYIDKSRLFENVQSAPEDKISIFRGSLRSWVGIDAKGSETKSPYPRMIRLNMDFSDIKGLHVRCFGIKPDDAKELVGQKILIQGILHMTGKGAMIFNSSISAFSGKVEPQYVGVAGLVSGEKIHQAIKAALDEPGALEEAAEIVASTPSIKELLQARGMSPLQLIKDLHTPASLKAGEMALSVAREAVVAEIRHCAKTGNDQASSEPAHYNIDDKLIAAVQAQKETLSPDQRRALNAIRLEMNAKRGARILLNGDVGTGKTLVFLLAIAAVARTTGKAVAVVVPSDLVARQIHAQAKSRFPDLKPALVIAGADKPTKAAKILIGTQALFNLPAMQKLEALVIDEQHKFSVDQRKLLAHAHTHIIEASATPIPRSLALAIFDGWKQVQIVNGPVPKTIRSNFTTQAQRRSVSGLVRQHIELGKKIIFLYHRVTGEGASVLDAGKRLSQHFPGQVSVLHGKLKAEAKQKALSAFASGEQPIIVASTAVEVGVDVPDVGLMVVSNADRFGVAQLHQLRGRLARNGGAADFVMLVDKSPSGHTLERLQAVCDHADGFSLAERDMEIRGFGDVLGELQSGRFQGTFKLPRLEVTDFLRGH